jgi:hypothetical protein
MKRSAVADKDLDRSRIMHGLLESVQRDSAGSQRDRASEFGVALGLVNAYLNYCIKKGHIRVKKIPAKRYVYYLTPKGFAEKSRLALNLVSNSFHSFRQAREEYAAAFRSLREDGATRVVLVGLSELAEVSILCAAECQIALAAIVDSRHPAQHYVGLPVVADFAGVPGGFDGAVITDLTDPGASYAHASTVLDAARVQAPAILGIAPPDREAAE